MRLLLINRHFGGEQVPTGRMLADVTAELVELGHEVTVFATRSNYAGRGRNDASNGRIKVIESASPGESFKVIAWVLFLLQAYWAVLRNRWDRCLVMTDPPFLGSVAMAANLFGARHKPVYWWTMDLYPEALVASGIITQGSFFERLLRFVNERSLRLMRGVICLDECQRQRMGLYSSWRSPQEFSCVVPPWDARMLAPVEPSANRFLAAYPSLRGKKIALYAGNLGQAHVFDEIVDAARALHTAGRADWMFVFVIRGSRRAALETSATNLPNIAILDYQPEEWTADLLSAACVHLITMRSGWDGIVVPSKLYAILQLGRPVLYIGPGESGTAKEIQRLRRGQVLPSGSDCYEVERALDQLALFSDCTSQPSATSKIHEAVNFLLS